MTISARFDGANADPLATHDAHWKSRGIHARS